MSKHKKSKLSIVSPVQNLYCSLNKFIQRLMRSLLRTWMAMNRRDRYGRAGFVLPTVTMVLLVVVLLTIAITLRSFDRAKIAQYRRVDEAVLQAATPALDRARAKVEYLLNSDPTLPKETPSDDALYNALITKTYTFDDEERLRILYDVKDDGLDATTQQEQIENNDFVDTAWRFPVDTNNNGKYDSYALYGIYFRSPSRDEKGEFNRPRTPLDARTPPLSRLKSTKSGCEATGTSANLVGDTSWFQSDVFLKKSFFVYTSTVPITEPPQNDPDYYEEYPGTPSFSALEYQQDWNRVPLLNNAVLYEDDLEITPGENIRLNGRISTNSNLVVTPLGSGAPEINVAFYLVSSKNSCFYTEENSKIVVGGNVINGRPVMTTPRNPVEVHLFQGDGNDPIKLVQQGITTTNQTVTENAQAAMYNTKAYEERIQALLTEALTKDDPDLVKDAIDQRFEVDSTLDPAVDRDKVRREELEKYIRDRTRRVPFAEVEFGTAATATLVGTGNTLAPDERYMLPTPSDGDVSIGTTGNSTYTKLTMQAEANYQFPATDPEEQENLGKEELLGDRIKVGNNLPAFIQNGEEVITEQQVDKENTKWTGSTKLRTRQSRIKPLADFGDPRRDGFWERAAAEVPETRLSSVGGLRVITGAGVYDRSLSFLPPPPTDAAPAGSTVVWPDSMPMSPEPGAKVYDYDNDPSSPDDDWPDLPDTTDFTDENAQFVRGDLRMRATAVYHYADNGIDLEEDPPVQTPIACVSSYYDPTSSITAENIDSLPWPATKRTTEGRSNNGIVYGPPSSSLSSKRTELEEQANLYFPDGRLVNPLLKQAVENTGDLTLAQQAAVDSTLCALDILDGAISEDDSVIPHGAIQEVSFLNPREVKAIEADDPDTVANEAFTLYPDGDLTTEYKIPLEERQPLEIRVTQLNLEQLRTITIAQSHSTGPEVGGNEYLLPFSGIIYASRDDALPDRTDASESDPLTTEVPKQSPEDFKLDPTRRPNGIMLVEGKRIDRTDDAGEELENVVQEKGLILVTNLPAYLQGDFNLHEGGGTTRNEFTDPFDWEFNKYYSRATLDQSFACRKGDPRLPDCQGDNWRPATVMADAITILSDNFRLGFRNEGDFDLRNNAGSEKIKFDLNGNSSTTDTAVSINEQEVYLDLDGNGNINNTSVNIDEKEVPIVLARRRNGFFANDFVVNGLSSGGFAYDQSKPKLESIRFGTPTGSEVQLTDAEYIQAPSDNQPNSSYFNNFITPVQRRGNAPEYVMEICLKLPVSSCQPSDWKVIIDANSNNTFDGSTDTVIQASTIPGVDGNSGTTNVGALLSGTTAKPPAIELQRYPRRVAFLRNTSAGSQYPLKAKSGTLPVPLGINSSSNAADFTGTTLPRTVANSLFFKTIPDTDRTLTYLNRSQLTASTVQQPLLEPVLQLYNTTETDLAKIVKSSNRKKLNGKEARETRWLPKAKDTTMNLVLATRDVPSRIFPGGTTGETNGGLQNLPRFIENWQQGSSETNIFGSFIQLGRSKYATAPYRSLNPPDKALFSDNNKLRYNIVNNKSGDLLAYFSPPVRNWGFDVGLLSQSPDLFAQKATQQDSGGKPSEYFREVSRDDDWVVALLCSKLRSDNSQAVDVKYRPNSCPN